MQRLTDAYVLLAEAVDLSVRLGEAIECCDDGIVALQDAKDMVDGCYEIADNAIGRLNTKRAYVFYRMGGHSQEVESGFKEARKWFSRAGNAYGAGEATIRLGISYRLIGDHKRSLECSRQVEDVVDLAKCRVENPSFYCYVRINQGDFHINAGDFEIAETCLSDAMQVANQLGTDLPTARRAQLNLQFSSLYYQVGKYALGEKYGKESLRLEEEAYGKGSVESCNGMNQVGWCLLRQDGRAEEALAQFEESYRIRHRLYGDTNPFTSVSLRNCAIAHMEMGGKWLEVAKEELGRVLAARRTLYADRPNQQGRMAETLLDLSKLHLRMPHTGSAEAALSYISDAERIYRCLSEDANTRSIASCFELRGEVAASQGDEEVARSCYEESLRLYRLAYGKDSDHSNIRRLEEKLNNL